MFSRNQVKLNKGTGVLLMVAAVASVTCVDALQMDGFPSRFSRLSAQANVKEEFLKEWEALQMDRRGPVRGCPAEDQLDSRDPVHGRLQQLVQIRNTTQEIEQLRVQNQTHIAELRTKFRAKLEEDIPEAERNYMDGLMDFLDCFEGDIDAVIKQSKEEERNRIATQLIAQDKCENKTSQQKSVSSPKCELQASAAEKGSKKTSAKTRRRARKRAAKQLAQHKAHQDHPEGHLCLDDHQDCDLQQGAQAPRDENESLDLDDECPICYESLQNPPEGFELLHGCPNGHRSHKKCFLSWYQKSQTCPSCRQAIEKPSSDE